MSAAAVGLLLASCRGPSPSAPSPAAAAPAPTRLSAATAAWQARYDKATQAMNAAADDITRFYALNDAAKAAFETARIDEAGRYAQELLDLADKFTNDWNDGNAIHDGHMVLGRIAARQGDLEAARRELLLAGGTKGSPQLNSFGPNMSLAKDLLEKKQSESVLEYFDLCGKFWQMGGEKLKVWSEYARGGGVPDFGANLLF